MKIRKIMTKTTMMLTQRRSTFCSIFNCSTQSISFSICRNSGCIGNSKDHIYESGWDVSSKDIPGIPAAVEDADPMQWLFIRLAWNRPQSGSLGGWSFTRDQRPIVSAHSHKHKAQTQTQTKRHRNKHRDIKIQTKTQLHEDSEKARTQ